MGIKDKKKMQIYKKKDIEQPKFIVRGILEEKYFVGLVSRFFLIGTS